MGVRPTLTLFLTILRTTLTHCRSWFMRTGGPSLRPILVHYSDAFQPNYEVDEKNRELRPQ